MATSIITATSTGIPSSSFSLRKEVTPLALYFKLFTSSFLITTLSRTLLFSPLFFGNFLGSHLVVSSNTTWVWILLVRAIDIVTGIYIWEYTPHGSNSMFFGALLAALSRASLYQFEIGYFLETYSTLGLVLLIDMISLAAGFALFKVFLPRQFPKPMPVMKRIENNRDFLVDIVMAYTLSTVIGAFSLFVLEGLGGQSFIKSCVYEVSVPSILVDMTSYQRIRNPRVAVPILRSLLQPLALESHLGHSFVTAVLSIPLVLQLSNSSPKEIFDLVFTLVFPSTTILLWNNLPISLFGATAVGITLGLRGAGIATLSAYLLQNLRSPSRIARQKLVIVKEGKVEILEIAGGEKVALELELDVEDLDEEEQDEEEEEEVDESQDSVEEMIEVSNSKNTGLRKRN